MIYHTRGEHANHYTSMLASSEVDRGALVSMLACSVVGRGFIGGVMVSMLASSVVDHWLCNLTIPPPMIYHTRGEHANHYTTNDLPH
jgi:hypothetical protein